MARIVVKTAHGPFILKSQAQPAALCMCGLSKNQPFCDKSHLKTLDEDDKKVYVYDDDGTREEAGSCNGNGNCKGDCKCTSGKHT